MRLCLGFGGSFIGGERGSVCCPCGFDTGFSDSLLYKILCKLESAREVVDELLLSLGAGLYGVLHSVGIACSACIRQPCGEQRLVCLALRQAGAYEVRLT